MQVSTQKVGVPAGHSLQRLQPRLPRGRKARVRLVEMNERGHFFSEGNYDILGPPLSDGDDELSWMAKQPWSNGKVGTIDVPRPAEWQMAVAAQGNPAYAAMIPQGFWCWCRTRWPLLRAGELVPRRRSADAVHRMALWRAEPGAGRSFQPNTSQEDLIRAAKAFDLAQQLPPVDWSKALPAPPGQRHHVRPVDGRTEFSPTICPSIRAAQ